MSDSNAQRWDPARYERSARFVSDLGMPVVDLLAPRDGERILDLGCGDGALSVKLVELGCTVVGVDASVEMVAAATARGLDAHVMDGQSLQFADEFDAVFSNAALHWMKYPEAVIAGVWRALKPGGRFVGELGGEGNVAAIVSAVESALAARGFSVPNRLYFPRPEEYRALLESGGFEVRGLELIPRPTLLPEGVRGWLETFAQPFTNVLTAEDKPRFLAEVIEELRELLCDETGNWRADYVRLRFSAAKPETAT
jgi:SAM-dependent methyltransferase